LSALVIVLVVTAFLLVAKVLMMVTPESGKAVTVLDTFGMELLSPVPKLKISHIGVEAKVDSLPLVLVLRIEVVV
jgi:hypothetical protein